MGTKKALTEISGRAYFLWSQLRDLNSWPADYEPEYQPNKINMLSTFRTKIRGASNLNPFQTMCQGHIPPPFPFLHFPLPAYCPNSCPVVTNLMSLQSPGQFHRSEEPTHPL